MANTVIFKGVEITLPSDVAFRHKNGCLEVDLTGLSGKLLLRPAASAELQASHQRASAAHCAPLQRMSSDSTLIKDSLEPPVSQGWNTLPPTWLNSSPVGKRRLDDSKGPTTVQRPSADGPSVFSDHKGQDVRSDADADAGHEDAGKALEQSDLPLEPTPEEQQCAEKKDSKHAATSVVNSQSARAEPAEEANKENDITDLRTPAPAAAKEPTSVGGEKRSSEARVKSGSASAKRQRGCGQAVTPSKELAGRWRPLETPKGSSEDTVPSARWGSSFTALSATQGIMYGGQSTEGHLGDAWLLDSGTMTWQQTATTDFGGFSDAAKAWHAAAVLKCTDGDQLVVYGGERSAAAEPPDGAELGEEGEEDDEDSEPIADVCQLCLQSHYWVVLPMEGETNSQLPARTGPTITAMPDGRGLVFGGLDLEGKFRNDAFIVDPRSCKWFGLGGIIKNAPPKPRAYHTATLVGDRIIVMGGLGSRLWSCKEVYSLQLGSWKWTEHTSEVEGDAPAPRSGHTAVALPDGRHLALFGGGDSDKDLFYANVAVLDTLTWQWSTPKLQSIARPSGRAGHSMALLRAGGGRPALVVHGGRTKDSKLCKDTWVLELTS